AITDEKLAFLALPLVDHLRRTIAKGPVNALLPQPGRFHDMGVGRDDFCCHRFPPFYAVKTFFCGSAVPSSPKSITRSGLTPSQNNTPSWVTISQRVQVGALVIVTICESLRSLLAEILLLTEDCEHALTALLEHLAEEIGNLVHANHDPIAFALRVAIEFGLNGARHNLLPDGPSLVHSGFAMKPPMSARGQ